MTSLALNHEDTYAIESAVRSAIDMVMNVFYRVNSQQRQEYHRNLSKKSLENQQLRTKVDLAERELKSLRRRVRGGVVEQSFGPPESRHHDASGHHASAAGTSSPHRLADHELPGSDHWETEFTALILNQNMTATDLHDGPSKAPPPHPHHHLHQDPLPGHTLAPGPAPSPPPAPPAPPVVKDEPCEAEAVYIKWEMCEQSLGEGQEQPAAPVEYSDGACGAQPESGPSLQLGEAPHGMMGSQGRERVDFSMQQVTDEMMRNHNKQQRRKQLTQQYSRRLKERIYNDPERLQAYRERERRRYHRRKVLIADLPEESRRLRREAWRAAATRYRARKTSTESLQTDPAQAPHHHLLLPHPPLQDTDHAPGQAGGGRRRGRPRGGAGRPCV